MPNEPTWLRTSHQRIDIRIDDIVSVRWSKEQATVFMRSGPSVNIPLNGDAEDKATIMYLDDMIRVASEIPTGS